MNKSEAIAWAHARGWTKVDAERAFHKASLQFPQDKGVVFYALIRFAGPELLHRQRLQGAQRSQVTKKTKEITQLAQDSLTKMKVCLDKQERESKEWMQMLDVFYQEAKAQGFDNPDLEEFLSQGGRKDAA